MAFTIGSAIDALSFLAILLSAALVYRHAPASRTTRAYLAFCLTLLGLTGFEFFMYSAASPEAAQAAARLLIISASGIPLGFMFFLRALQSKPWLSTKVGAALAFFLLVALLALTGLVENGVAQTSEGYAYVPGMFFTFYALGLAALMVIAVLGFAFYYLENKTLPFASRIRLFLAGTVLITIAGVGGNLILPVLGLPSVRLASLAAGFFAALIGYTAYGGAASA